MNETLAYPYTIKTLPTEEFHPLFLKLKDQHFADHLFFWPPDIYSQAEKDNVEALGQNMGQPFRLNLGLYHHEELIGWSWGYQSTKDTFHTCNSVVFPTHRRKGLYTRIMQQLMDDVLKMGFQTITSCHTVTNNDVLITKLKFGFVITGFDISDANGLVVKLTYFTNPLRRKILGFRAGRVPDTEVRQLLKL